MKKLKNRCPKCNKKVIKFLCERQHKLKGRKTKFCYVYYCGLCEWHYDYIDLK